MNERREWCHAVDTHGVSELITHSPLIIITSYLYHMEVLISESKLTKVLHTYLTMSFEGFDDCYYDWSEFNCGMGVCCDPYAIGFILPRNEYNDYLFKLVDDDHYNDNGHYPSELSDELPEPCHDSPDVMNPEFNTIILSEDMYYRLESLFGNIDVWGKPLLSIINKVFNTKAHHLFYL